MLSSVIHPQGAPARVEFFDGEIIHGLVQEYRMEDSGFFLYPTSPESNNEKVFRRCAVDQPPSASTADPSTLLP